ncbi:hypothetical protein FISHEDRAFT_74007 [Fistulina hepatica ATCC 64428]|uniref:Yeast cell wall synthesis Kre9/Knh1-like N-terminal domain-containing protein n=1 Tax=Fistulina hepatica ATCC 64428 TaxID=1128425 RepID=A0A0D7ACE9_9AGAR|nr:hypothetical protein FISHEDRAFT_74007 [Fistulina hepatica ATCC 64428]
MASALTLNVPSTVTSGGTVTITWTTTSGDPSTFSLYLINQSFNDNFGIANNVETSLGTITIALPAVDPGDGFSLEAVDISDVNTVYSSTSDFAIGASTYSASSVSTVSGTSTFSGSAVLTSGSATASASASGSAASSSASAASASKSASKSASASASSAASASSSSSSNGAVTIVSAKNVAAGAMVVLSTVAGAFLL